MLKTAAGLTEVAFCSGLWRNENRALDISPSDNLIEVMVAKCGTTKIRLTLDFDLCDLEKRSRSLL